jgi:CRISPR-associated protein Cas1
VAGKIQNSRLSVLRTARETESEEERAELHARAEELATVLRWFEHDASCVDSMRGYEGQAASIYFGVFSLHFRQGVRESFRFKTRTRRPPLDSINCLLSFLYALL